MSETIKTEDSVETKKAFTPVTIDLLRKIQASFKVLPASYLGYTVFTAYGEERTLEPHPTLSGVFRLAGDYFVGEVNLENPDSYSYLLISADDAEAIREGLREKNFRESQKRRFLPSGVDLRSDVIASLGRVFDQ